MITGASRGIGLATVKKFLNSRWHVIGTYNNNLIEFNAENLTILRLDLSSPESIKSASDKIKKITESIDVLVNNAGVVLDYDDRDLDIDKARKTFEIDVFGLIDFTERMLPLYKKGSHIINIGSEFGAFSSPINSTSHSSYRIAKAAVHMYTRVLTHRLQDREIVVSALDPGWVKTDMGRLGVKNTDEEQPNREPEDAAEDIYQLAVSNPESGYLWRCGKKREW